MNINFANPEAVLKLILLIISPQLIISAVECLYTRTIYQQGNLLSWPYIKKSKKLFYSNRTNEKLFDLLFAYPNSLFLVSAKLLLSIFIIFDIINNRNYAIEIIALTIITLLVNLRDTYSNNGSDQLTSIILIALSIAALRRGSVIVEYVSILFIAFQALLSYFTSGIYKFINVGWRNGENLQAILCTEVFGNRQIAKMMDRVPNSYILASFAVMFGEIFLGLSFLMPPFFCLCILLTGILFHIIIAAVMGLNTFVWTFASTYPAIYFVSLHYFNY